MAVGGDRFERAAQTVVERIIQLLDAPAAVLEPRSGRIVGLGNAAGGVPDGSVCVRVPVALHGTEAEVLVGQPRGDEALSPRLTSALVQLLIAQATTAEPSGGRYAKDRLLHDLLHGIAQDDAVLHEAALLGLDLTPPRAVILIDAADYILTPDAAHSATALDAQVRQRAQHIIGIAVSFFILPSDTICGYLGDGVVAVLKASDSRNLRSWVADDGGVRANGSWANLAALKRAGAGLLRRLEEDTHAAFSIGIGRYHPGIPGLARSFEDARAALSLGTRVLARGGVHCLDSLGVAAFVGVPDERTKAELAVWLLGPLDHAPELITTLEAYFAADGCPSVAAARLAIHRNTLGYRLDKIASLTGLDPRHFDDAVQLRLALLLRG